jgi:flagellar biosynthesis protein FlhB
MLVEFLWHNISSLTRYRQQGHHQNFGIKNIDRGQFLIWVFVQWNEMCFYHKHLYWVLVTKFQNIVVNTSFFRIELIRCALDLKKLHNKEWHTIFSSSYGREATKHIVYVYLLGSVLSHVCTIHSQLCIYIENCSKRNTKSDMLWLIFNATFQVIVEQIIVRWS